VIDEYVTRSRASQGRQLPRSAPAPPAPDPSGPATTVGPNGRPSRSSRHRLSSRIRRFWDATAALAIAEFRIRYLDSALGYVWALGEPLLMFTVLYFVFSRVVDLQTVPHYPAKLLLGVVLFGFFTEASLLAMTSLVTRANLLRRIAFPASAVPLSSTLTTMLTFGISLVVALAFALVSGIAPTALWLQLIPLLLLLLLTTAGASLLLSLLFVALRDVRQIWGVATRMLFFATPVFYPVQAVPETMRHVMMLNPLAVVVVQANHAVIDSQAPTAASASAGAGWLAIPVALAIAMPVVGGWLFARSRSLPERI
jgi:ABC-2 type transport system permease protein